MVLVRNRACRSVCFWVYILMPTEHLDRHLPGQEQTVSTSGTCWDLGF